MPLKPDAGHALEFSEIRSPLLAYDGSQRASAAMAVAAEVCSQLSLPLAILAVPRGGEQGRRSSIRRGATCRRTRSRRGLYAITGHAYECIPAEIRAQHGPVFMGLRTDTGASSSLCWAARRVRAPQRAPARCS